MQKYLKYIFPSIIAILAVFLWIYNPETSLSPQGLHLCIIFGTMVIFILCSVFPLSLSCMIGVFVAVATGTLTLPEALSGFSDKTVWLLVYAFFISIGFVNSGLGARVAYLFLSKFGNTSLGLSYSIIFTETIFATMIPSASARGGAIMFPIIRSITEEYEREIKDESLLNRISGFLIMIGFHTNIITSAMFLTAMVANPLIGKFALEFGVRITWMNWMMGAILPGILCLLALPIVMHLRFGIKSDKNIDISALAKKNLENLGKLTRKEISMLLSFVLLIALWILGEKLNIDATTTAMLGAIIILLAGIAPLNRILSDASTWDAMIWFSAFVMFARFLQSSGVIKWLADGVSCTCDIFDAWYLNFALLSAIYFYIHYFMASMTSHIVVLYQVFVSIVIAKTGVSPLVACLWFAYMSSLCGCLTHYGSAAAPIFYGTKLISIKNWWFAGFIMSIVYLAIWGFVGPVWWRLIGLC